MRLHRNTITLDTEPGVTYEYEWDRDAPPEQRTHTGTAVGRMLDTEDRVTRAAALSAWADYDFQEAPREELQSFIAQLASGKTDITLVRKRRVFVAEVSGADAKAAFAEAKKANRFKNQKLIPALLAALPPEEKMPVWNEKGEIVDETFLSEPQFRRSGASVVIHEWRTVRPDSRALGEQIAAEEAAKQEVLAEFSAKAVL